MNKGEKKIIHDILDPIFDSQAFLAIKVPDTFYNLDGKIGKSMGEEWKEY